MSTLVTCADKKVSRDPSCEADLLEHIARDWAGEGDRWNTESSGTDRVHNTGDVQDDDDGEEGVDDEGGGDGEDGDGDNCHLRAVIMTRPAESNTPRPWQRPVASHWTDFHTVAIL